MKFCPHCGESIADPSFQFCMNCGQRLPLPAGEQATAGEESTATAPQPAPAPATPETATPPQDATVQFTPVGAPHAEKPAAKAAAAAGAATTIAAAIGKAAEPTAEAAPAQPKAPQAQRKEAAPAHTLFEEEPGAKPADLFAGEEAALPDDLFAGETAAPTATTLFKVDAPPPQEDFFKTEQGGAAKPAAPAAPVQRPRPQQAARPAQKPQPAPILPQEGNLQTEPLKVSQIQQRLMDDDDDFALQPPQKRREVPPPPPIDLPGYDDYDDDDDDGRPPRSGGRTAITVIAIVLLFALVTAGVTMAILYSSNRPSKLVDSFIESIEAGAGQTEDAKKLEALQGLANDGKLRLEGASPTTEGWSAFFNEFGQQTNQNELKSQLLAQAADSDFVGAYPAIEIESEKLMLFIKRYKIVINGVSLLAPDAQEGSVILLDGVVHNGYKDATGILVEGIMPGRYECRVVAPGTDAAAAIPVDVSIFNFPGPTTLESDQFYADLSVGNCRSDDAIIYVNGTPVMETPTAGTVLLSHVALGSTIRIEIMEDGVKLAAETVFASPNETSLNFGEYVTADGGEPADDEGGEEGKDETEGENVDVSISETEINNLLATFYTSYLKCINDQSMDSIQLTTSSANQKLGARITSSGNASNLFEYVGAACKYSSVKQTERNGRTYVEFNAQFKYNYKPREGEGEYTESSNYQSVQLVYNEGKWLVNQMVMVNANDYNSDTFATFE